MRLAILLAGLIAQVSVLAMAAEGCRHQDRLSGPHQASLLELYTSEGCSSCPPADQALSRLLNKADPSLVALAFHVDYWDYLGWADRLASPRWSQRQYQRARQAGVRTVYTPQFVLNGRDVATGAERLLQKQLAQPATAPMSIRLSLNAAEKGLAVAVEVKPLAAVSAGKVYAALYENGLESRVQAGENAGTVLRHDAVVRGLLGPWQLDAGGRLQMTGILPLGVGQRLMNSGVAVWVEHSTSGQVLQALAVACQ